MTNATQQLSFRYVPSKDAITQAVVEDFLRYVIIQNELPIESFLTSISDTSIFLVAGTGLGKTLAMPIKLLAVKMQQYTEQYFDGKRTAKMPTIWVVVPKVPIASSLAQYLNSQYEKFALSRNIQSNYLPLFGYRTSVDTQNTQAPIQFITTGVLPLIAKSGELDSMSDRVIIDEAHVVLESDEAVELAIAYLWQSNITVDYMSATVDTAELEMRLRTQIIRADTKRFTNFYHNTQKPLLESIEDIIGKTLIRQDINSEYYPHAGFDFSQSVLDGTLAIDRASGMLVIVNSFASAQSDANDVLAQIKTVCEKSNIRILMFAGKVERDKSLKARFVADFDAIQRAKQRYVIISTNIVEMGITWSTLDYVVTMDSEFDSEYMHGFMTPALVPLGTNALKQRGGRVGRTRAGCVYICRDFGASYTSLDDDDLNTTGLAPEPIKFPLQQLMYMPYKLAYECITNGINSDDGQYEFIKTLAVPSATTDGERYDLVYKVQKVCQYYQNLDIMGNYELVDEKIPFAELPEKLQILKLSARWVGSVQYPWVLEAMKALYSEPDRYYVKNYSKWVFYNILAVLIDYPNVQFLMIDPADGERASTTNTNSPNGLMVYGGKYVNGGLPNNSDLISIAEILTEGFDRISGIYSNVTYQSIIESLEYSDRSLGFALAMRLGLDPQIILKFHAALMNHFDEAIKHLKKLGFKKPMFYELLNGEPDGDDSGMGIAYAVEVNTLKGHRTIRGGPTYYLFKTYHEMLAVYKAIGVCCKLTKTNQVGVYLATYWFEELEFKSLVDQHEHFCQLDDTHTFWAIMMPKIDRATNEMYPRLEHFFREDDQVYVD